jgi:NADPH-dependent ferric siderophore reductase
MMDEPHVQRVRHELKRRRLSVKRIERLPPGMVRVVLGGDDLAGFTSLGFDDHVKLFFPNAAAGEARRDFTPRRFDPDAGELWIDFFLHTGGPATEWAATAVAGQLIEVGGPKGSSIIDPHSIDLHLLIGDETALPAITRRLEELPSTANAFVVVEAATKVDRPLFASRASMRTVWAARDSATSGSAAALIDVLRSVELPSARCLAWIAHESRVARAIRAYLIEECGFQKRWIKAAGYWQSGVSGVHEKISDPD